MCAMKTTAPKGEPIKADIITPATVKPFAAGDIWEVDNNPDTPEWLKPLKNCKSEYMTVCMGDDVEPAKVTLKTLLGDVSFVLIPRELTLDDDRTFFTLVAPEGLIAAMKCIEPNVAIMDVGHMLSYVGPSSLTDRLVRFSEYRDGVAMPRLTAMVRDWHTAVMVGAASSTNTTTRQRRSHEDREDCEDHPDVSTILRMVFGWRRTECADRLMGRDFDINDIVWDLACAVESLTEELKATKRTWREPTRRG